MDEFVRERNTANIEGEAKLGVLVEPMEVSRPEGEGVLGRRKF